MIPSATRTAQPFNPMNPSGAAHNTPEASTTLQTDSMPSQTSKANIARRVITGIGKVLLGVFTVPAMVVLTTLSGFIIGVATTYHTIIPSTYKNSVICALILSVTIAPPCALILGGLCAVMGVFYGISRGVKIAHKFSLEPLKTTWDDTRNALSGQTSKEAENVILQLKTGYKLAKKMNREIKASDLGSDFETNVKAHQETLERIMNEI